MTPDARFIRPVLTAMMVYVIGVGVVALLGAIAVWRAPAACPMQRGSPELYIVQIGPAALDARADSWAGLERTRSS